MFAASGQIPPPTLSRTRQNTRSQSLTLNPFLTLVMCLEPRLPSRDQADIMLRGRRRPAFNKRPRHHGQALEQSLFADRQAVTLARRSQGILYRRPERPKSRKIAGSDLRSHSSGILLALQHSASSLPATIATTGLPEIDQLEPVDPKNAQAVSAGRSADPANMSNGTPSTLTRLSPVNIVAITQARQGPRPTRCKRNKRCGRVGLQARPHWSVFTPCGRNLHIVALRGADPRHLTWGKTRGNDHYV